MIHSIAIKFINNIIITDMKMANVLGRFFESYTNFFLVSTETLDIVRIGKIKDDKSEMSR